MPCNKTSFRDEVAAEFYLAKLKKTSMRIKVPQRTYLCERCFKWHLTSQTLEEENMLRELMSENQELRILIKEKNARINELENQFTEYRKAFLGMNRNVNRKKK